MQAINPHLVQGISVDMDDEYDPVACAEQAQQERQRELEIEAELRVKPFMHPQKMPFALGNSKVIFDFSGPCLWWSAVTQI